MTPILEYVTVSGSLLLAFSLVVFLFSFVLKVYMKNHCIWGIMKLRKACFISLLYTLKYTQVCHRWKKIMNQNLLCIQKYSLSIWWCLVSFEFCVQNMQIRILENSELHVDNYNMHYVKPLYTSAAW